MRAIRCFLFAWRVGDAVSRSRNPVCRLYPPPGQVFFGHQPASPARLIEGEVLALPVVGAQPLAAFGARHLGQGEQAVHAGVDGDAVLEAT